WCFCGCGDCGGGGSCTCPPNISRRDITITVFIIIAISSQGVETMTCRSSQGSINNNNPRSACGDVNGCGYGCLCGGHQIRTKLAGKRLRQSFLQLESLKADAQLEAAVG
ncbi:unnamed protein product, partial [Laminaria digitata]